MSDQPAKRFRIGAVNATVWENGNGDKTFYNVTVHRSYKDEDEWKETGSFGSGDLANLERVVSRAETWISQQ